MTESPTVVPTEVSSEQLIDRADGVERRLARLPVPPSVAVAGVGVLLMLLVDTELFALVPLLASVDREYGLTATQGAWALSATSIATASSIAVLSRLADIFGLRRLLMISLTMVVIGTLLCGLAQGPVVLILGRALAGVSAAPPIYLPFFGCARKRHRRSTAIPGP